MMLENERKCRNTQTITIMSVYTVPLVMLHPRISSKGVTRKYLKSVIKNSPRPAKSASKIDRANIKK